jgi:hypothetical protein
MNSLKIATCAALLGSFSAFAQTPPPEDPIDPQVEPQKSVTMPEFRTLDINGDGSVSEQEAQANATVWEKFAELDSDKNGSLSTDEYAKAQGSETPPKEETKY